MKMMEVYIPICAVLFTVWFDNTLSSTIQHREGDLCDIKHPERTCQDVSNCPLEAESIIKGTRPDLCGISHSYLVCCDKASKSSNANNKYEQETNETTESKTKIIVKREAPGEKSKIMCAKYAESVFSSELGELPLLPLSRNKTKIDECGIEKSPALILIPSYIAKPKEFPHMALIGMGKNGSDEKKWWCSGSLISEKWILSAAHCASTPRGTANHALLGDLKIRSEDDAKDSQPIELKIVEIVLHPEYKKRQAYNDIALFKLERQVEFNKFIRPICLNSDSGPYKRLATATGWGSEPPFNGESILKKAVLNLHDTAECSKIYANASNRLLPNGITAQNMLCIWESKYDVCRDFTGGPLQIELDKPYCMYSIIGIVTSGKNCNDHGYPSAHTRVSYYVPWIESIVWP